MPTEKFESMTIFKLQQQIVRLRKQMALKQSDWKQERMILMQKNELINMELAQGKQRENNLKKINQTLQLAQYEKKDDGIKDLLKEIGRAGFDKKQDNNLRIRFQNQFRRKQQILRDQLQEELEQSLKQQEILSTRRFENEIHHLQQQNSRLQEEIGHLHSKIGHYQQQISQLREEIQQSSNVKNSFASSSFSNRFFNYANNSKQNSPSVNTSNIVSEMLCEVCGQVFTTNDFFEHIQDCEKQEEQNIEELMNRKREIENQLEILQYQKSSKPKKIIMIVNDKPHKKKKQKSFIKSSYQSSPSKSFLESSLKVSNKNRFYGF